MMTIRYTLSSDCFWSLIILNASICELMVLSAICRDTREALERGGMPVMVRVLLNVTRMTDTLHDKLRLVCIQFPSLHRQSMSILTDILNDITQIPTVVKVELDLHSIEVGVLQVFRPTMLRLCDALEYKNLLLRCRFGCYRHCLGLSRCWSDIDKPGLLSLLQGRMCCHNIEFCCDIRTTAYTQMMYYHVWVVEK